MKKGRTIPTAEQKSKSSGHKPAIKPSGEDNGVRWTECSLCLNAILRQEPTHSTPGYHICTKSLTP